MTTFGFLDFDREEIYAALFALVSSQGVYSWATTPSRRLKLWADVPQRPALFQFEGGDETWDWSNSANPKVTLHAKLFVYWNCKDNDDVGASTMNAILNAVTRALIPSVAEAARGGGKQTLGGLVQWARIQGNVFRDPGDLDGDGMAVIPISILVN